MAIIRLPQEIWESVYRHLFSTAGEHFAFLLAKWCYSANSPVFMVSDVVLVPDEHVTLSYSGYELYMEGILLGINAAVRSGAALIEVHNHGGVRPRFSITDRQGLDEFPTYVFGSLPDRPYVATVWGDSTVYGEYFLPQGDTGVIDSITVVGDSLRQVVSRDDDLEPISSRFSRQLPWFTAEGQCALGRMRVAIVGAGGLGAPLAQNLVFMGARDFLIIEDDRSDESNMNRLTTAMAADIDTPKGILARRFILGVAPDARVTLLEQKLQTPEALDAIKGVDAIFGGLDNDGARLILNELALSYGIPYFDLAVGIDAEAGNVTNAGGRVAIVQPGGPCLHCIGEIDLDEARYYLNTPEQRAFQIRHGYVRGMEVEAPSVVSLNATIAGIACNEFAVFVSGLRPVNAYTELDLLGIGRPIKSQWVVPTRVSVKPGCVQCASAGVGDAADIERYARAGIQLRSTS